jgi:alpha-beta hydrolase superfamily lysophospholipase
MSLKWIVGVAAAFGLSTGALAQTAATPVTLQAGDGVSISGLVYPAAHPKAIILLFHQADSSKAEYATIAPRLAAMGFTALAIDQRSGGSLYGPNETAARLSTPSTYEQAKPDLVAALDWASPQHLPVALWGSSYSAALVFEVAAEHPDEVSAVVAFSPGEYLEDRSSVRRAAVGVRAPIYVHRRPMQRKFDLRGRTHHCLAQPLPPPRQGLGEPEPQRARLPQTRFHPHADKALQSFMKSPDGL